MSLRVCHGLRALLYWLRDTPIGPSPPLNILFSESTLLAVAKAFVSADGSDVYLLFISSAGSVEMNARQ